MARATILLVEDNPFQAKETMNTLEKAGYMVFWENTGMAGFKKAKTEDPDLILLDVVLPDRDGNEICRYIKMDDAIKNTPVIMLTSRSKVKDKVKGLNIGADDYLPKPFDEEELLARINAFLRITKLQDELKGKNEQLEDLLKKVEVMAITDVGTGLFNRRHFMKVMDREFTRAKRYNTRLTCLMMDIDHFKSINDTYGHLVGDSVLKDLAGIILANFRHAEIAARYGGEEFVLLLPETTAEEAQKPSQRLIEQVESYRFKGLPPEKSVTISIGVGSLPDSGIVHKEDLIRCADYALYAAKRNGRNRIEIATGSEALTSDSNHPV